MSDHTSDTGLRELDRNSHRPPLTSPIFRYSDLCLPQSQPGQETTGAFHLRPSALVADQDRRAAYESESEENFAFQSQNEDDEDFYDSASDTSSAPIMASSRCPETRASPAPKVCACGAPWHSGPDDKEVDSFPADNGTASRTQVPSAPAKSPNNEQKTPRKPDASYRGPLGSSSDWPDYSMPTIEDEEADTIKCCNFDMRNSTEPDTALPRSQSSDWLKGQLERKKNASSTTIHANVHNIDDVEKHPASHLKQNVDDTFTNPELQYWNGKRQEMLQWIQQVDVWQAQRGQQLALIASNSLTSRLSEAECMVDMMDRRGFKPPTDWLAEFFSVFGLARRGKTYALMAFVIAEFGEFFSQDQELGSEDHPSHELVDLGMATNKGVIDACQAVKSLMLIGSSRPTEAWCKQYDTLTANAQDSGDIEPLIEFVRFKAENISKRNASERATKVKDSLRQNYNAIDLDESGTQIESSLKNGSAVGYDEHHKGKGPEYSQHNVHQEYGIWLNRNFQSETELSGNRFIYIAKSTYPIRAGLDNFETNQPIVVRLSHYFDEVRLLASVSIVALAVRVTPSEKSRSVDTYAEVWLRDSEHCERFNSPFKVQGLSAKGQPFDLDEEAIIAMIEAKLGDSLQATASEDVESDSAWDSHSNSSSSPDSGPTLHRRDSDQSQLQSPSPSRQPHIHLTPEQTREMHPNVFAERGMTLVPLHDFPDLLADQYNFRYYQLAIGASASSVLVNCERCHKTLASFENVEAEPTVARREKDEPGDTYIVTSISSLDTTIDSVDKVKRVWLQIGTHKYFMRANEAGVERSHECISIQGTLGVAMDQEEAEAAASYYTQGDEEALGYDRLGDLPSQELRDDAQRPPFEREQSPDQKQPGPIPSVCMPSSMQFLSLHSNFPTAELTSVREPCTIISVCEQRGIIHGVYQDVIGYRAIFRGPGERGNTVYLDIRNGRGGHIGRLSRIRHYEAGLMNGQIFTFTAEEDPEERIDAMPVARQPAQGYSMGLRGGVQSVADWADTETDTYWSDDEETSLRGGANADYSDSDDDVTPRIPKQEWIQAGVNLPTPESQQASLVSATLSSSGPPKEERISTGTTSSAPKNQQTASISASLFSDPPKGEFISARSTTAAPQDRPASASASLSVQPKQRWIPTGVSDQQPKPQQKRCNCLSRKDKEPARKPWVGPGGPTIWTSPPADLKGKEPSMVASPHQVVPSENTPPMPQDGSERIPSWLQVGPQSDPDQVDGEELVFTESYKNWLRDMYTRPSYSTCGTNPAPGPSFQYFWQNREAGRAATIADGSVFRPRTRPESEYHDPAVDEGEYIRMESDGHAGCTREEESPFVRSFGSNARHLDQIPRRWHDADVDKGEHIRLQEEPPRTEEMTSLNPALQNILNRFLRGRAIQKARVMLNAPTEEN